RAVRAGARTAGMRVDAFVPAVAALPHAVQDERFSWADGETVAEVEAPGRRLASRRRLTGTNAPALPPPAPVPERRRRGDDARPFADACRAAPLPAAEPLVLRPGAGGADEL